MEEEEDGHDESGSTTLFYSEYADFGNALREQVRREAFGEDIGQFGWMTADEDREFFRWLGLGPGKQVLDIACGSGGPSLFMARTTGCQVTGVDVNQAGITTASEAAASQGLDSLASFQQADAARQLPFDEGAFDAVVCIDAMNHLYNRDEVLRDWYRVLRPGGRILFTDPIVVGGMISRDEMMTRSGSMGLFVFTPPGVNERIIQAAGFQTPMVGDLTANIAGVSKNWHSARAAHETDLRKLEGDEPFETFQSFLAVVHNLSNERRLLRLVYIAQKQ